MHLPGREAFFDLTEQAVVIVPAIGGRRVCGNPGNKVGERANWRREHPIASAEHQLGKGLGRVCRLGTRHQAATPPGRCKIVTKISAHLDNVGERQGKAFLPPPVGFNEMRHDLVAEI